MNPVFYIGSGCGEIHLKINKSMNFTIKIGEKGTPRPHYNHFNGLVDKAIINGLEFPELRGRRISYTLISEMYKISTGEELKYRSIVSARTNLEAVQKLIEELAPDLHIDFKPIEKVKPEVEYSIDDQIFNFWVKNNV